MRFIIPIIVHLKVSIMPQYVKELFVTFKGSDRSHKSDVSNQSTY